MNASERGDRGERGPKGDHGQHGEAGCEGKQGATGATGAPGAPAAYLSRNRTLALFAFVVLAFLLLAVRSEIHTRDIREGVYENCLTRAEVATALPNCERFR